MRHILIEDPSKKIKNHKKKKGKSPSQKWLTKIENKVFKIEDFLDLCHQDEVFGALLIDETSFDFLASIGMGLRNKEGKIFLKTYSSSWREQIFCFVDIETTGTSPLKDNLLEIGAILCNGQGEVFGTFESCIKNEDIPQVIQKITGITNDDVCEAPDVVEVLKQFRKFLGESVLVAHNAEFDYSFLDSLYWKYFGIGLYNQKICTLQMAQKLIESPRYGLQFLNDFLEIYTPICHRAYSDALTCKEVFMACLQRLPQGIHTTQNLIDFTLRRNGVKRGT